VAKNKCYRLEKHELLRRRLDYCAFRDIVILPTSRAGVSKMHSASDAARFGRFLPLRSEKRENISLTAGRTTGKTTF